ncbi:hypothetical protein CONLIGDRAFT_626722 [Coniochaeta ligniaria NRRL 30616]|uniref:Chromo domain-containing protein n=1 Tax=Coniochaeta ligniaria NRRL 30616 TaxID=1408157 RepID=A0A1J7J5N9_9PEZI|nr:hypothetical protein CONLIGDRAFT_626722 [Coniochaeta ligniaria NRRL 30616]
MATTQQGRKAGSRIEIPLHSKPKRLYRSGPPPPALTLVPPRDSTAYIVSKIVLPSVLETAAERTTRRRLYYTVGWTDLPSAKVAVLATRILDYVSPRELEDWEYNDFLRREEEKRLAKLEAAITPVKKKKGGRPRKGPSDSQREAEAAVAKEAAVLDSETEAILAEKKAGGEPSLSTPSKKKLEELLRETEAEETGEESENAAIARQLYSEGEEAGYRSEARYEEEMDIDSEAVDLLAPAPAGEHMSSRASSLAAAIPATFARTSPALSSSLKPGSANSSVAFPSTPGSVNHTQSKSTAGGVKQVSTLRKDVKQGSRTSSRASTPRTSSYLPAPSTNGAPPPRRESTGFTPVITPVPVPVIASSFTTASPAVPVISTPTAAASPAEPSQPPPTSTKKRSAKKRKKEKRTKEEPVEEKWEVKRLEGDRYDYDAAGNLVRYFKVRWVGDWPASQNPTWEPEENITEELRDEYLKQQETKMKNGYLTTGKSPAKSSPAQPRPFLPKKKYSSVAEAFEGEIHELEAAAKRAEPADDDQDEEETFVVADEAQPKPGKEPGSNFSAFDQKLASYRDTFGRGGLGH